MRTKIQPRIIWITGASSGIGKALTEVFAEMGDIVIATSRRMRTLKLLERQMSQRGNHCEVMLCDVGKESDIRRAVQSILKRHGKVDILINNAGVTSFKNFLQTPTVEFDEILGTNLRSLFLTSKAIVPAMLRKKQGSIINILSYAAKTTYTKSAAYSAAKSGAEALMNVLRAEVRERGIRVTNVYPGAVLTPMWSKKLRNRYASSMMAPRDIAKLVHHLSLQPNTLHVEELIVRPPTGDLKV